MTTSTDLTPATITAIAFAMLPNLGQAMADGTFQGITTSKDGTHHAVVLLDAKPASRLSWPQAKAWAESVGAQLPSRPVAALLYANAKPMFKGDWHWTSDELQADTGDEEDSSSAWYCYFNGGYQNYIHRSAEGAAVAVLLIPLVA